MEYSTPIITAALTMIVAMPNAATLKIRLGSTFMLVSFDASDGLDLDYGCRPIDRTDRVRARF